jgi:putative DNA primase/helicase
MTRTWVDETRNAAQGQWRGILAALGIEVPGSTHKHGPCPGCGGRDRFRFDDKQGRGTFICSAGGGEPIAGDGFLLLQHVRGWRFIDAARAVAGVLGIDPSQRGELVPTQAEQIGRHRVRITRMLMDEQAESEKRERAKKAIQATLQGCKPINQVSAVWTYLTQTRGIPEKYVAAAQDLLAHPGLEYFYKPSREERSTTLGTYPALIGVCRSQSGEIISLHRTYVTPQGQKLALKDPRRTGETLAARKLMTPIDERHYAIALYAPVNGRLGVSEGIETALSAAILNDLPCHSAIDSGKLVHYAPPPGVHTLFLFADDDPAGRHGAESLQMRLKIERPEIQTAIYYPRQRGGHPGMDWDDLRRRGPDASHECHVSKPRPG